MSSENRNKCKKRKREPQISSRRQKDEEDDDDEDDAAAVNADDDGEQDEDYDLQPNPNPSPNPNPVPSLLSRESEVVSGEGERLSSFPPVVRRLVNRFHSSVLNVAALERALERGESRNMPNPPVLENVSYGQLQALSSVPADCLSYGGDDQERAFVITPPAIMEGKGVIKHVRNEQPHVVPMHSDWFSLGTIHRLERQNVPNFFSGRSASLTPEKYMECRNRIVAMYVQNPEKRLLAANCHGLFSGIDPEDVNRIVRFLDNWGIINYCAASSPIRELLNPSSSLREDVDGELHVPSTALKSISSLIKFDKPQCRLKPRDVYASSSNHEDEIPDLDSKIREQLTENRCFHCLQPIPIIYYQSQKEADTLLCSDCFHEGVFVTGHSSIDFVKMDSTKEYNDVDSESWTDQETLLLLEAMEMYNENWNDIADHVGSKSKAQCIIQFIRMPMEGGRLENIDVPKVSMSSDVLPRHPVTESHSKSNGHLTGTCHSNTDSDSKLPFLSSGNPAMALVSFLAAAVGPRVAAACAHACLAVLCDTDGSVSPSNKNPEDSGHVSGSVPENTHGNVTKSNLQTDEALKLGGRPVSAEKVKSAAEAGLAAAALKAKVFGDHEEREIQRLSANIINHQLKRLELKLKQFAEVETLLMKECEQVEKSRQRLAAERTRIISSRFGAPGMASPPSMLATNLVNNNAGPSRQTVISPTATASQPGINYGNNQMMHPHMSFVPNQQQQHPSQQQMFGFGPRLPLNAIQPPSSVHNVMFNNTSSNSQHNMGHPMLRPVSNANSGLS
uniref:SWI/SNF complex subunit SWI3C n=1 Tax=Kalanchoe fedtschenkoi TaxID=63787 RepID=A0A7N0ZRS4_KALFE